VTPLERDDLAPLADAELLARAAAVMADPDAHSAPPRTGPSRTELLASLSPA
jgi:hypothetical protein